jgi:hypothetical protein
MVSKANPANCDRYDHGSCLVGSIQGLPVNGLAFPLCLFDLTPWQPSVVDLRLSGGEVNSWQILDTPCLAEHMAA